MNQIDQRIDGRAERFRRDAVEVIRLVRPLDRAGEIPGPTTNLGNALGLRQQTVFLLQCHLRPLALGDVMLGGDPDLAVFAMLKDTHACPAPEAGAVLPHILHLAGPTPPGSEGRHYFLHHCLWRSGPGRIQHGDGLADQFTPRVAKHQVKLRIGFDDQPIAGAAEVDPFFQVSEHGRLQLQMLLGLPRLGHIHGHAIDSLLRNNGGPGQSPERAVLVPVAVFKVESRSPLGELRQLRSRGRPVVRVNEVHEVGPDGGLPVAPQHQLPALVHPLNLAFQSADQIEPHGLFKERGERRLRPPALGDVAHARHDVFPVHVDAARADLHGEGAAIFTAVQAEVSKTRPVAHLLFDAAPVGRLHRWINVCHPQLHDLLARVAQVREAPLAHVEEPAGGRVDDLERVIGLVHQFAEHSPLRLRPPAVGDVANVALDHLPAIHVIDIADELHLDRPSLTGLQRQMIVADVSLLLQLGKLLLVGDQIPEEAHFPELLPEKFLLGEAQQVDQEGVRILDHPGLDIENKDAVLRRLEEPAVAALGGGQRGGGLLARGDVRVRADHPRGLAGGIAFDQPADR